MNPLLTSLEADAHRNALLREAEERRRLAGESTTGASSRGESSPTSAAGIPSPTDGVADCARGVLGAIRRRRIATVRLRDGASVRLRAAAPADAPRLRDLFFTLSDTTRYLYFSTGVPATDAWAERFATLGRADGEASYAMVVEAGEALAGVARFDRAPAPTGPSAELGILLADAWQARGLGREVVAWLRDEAVCRGLSEFTAVALGENRRVLRLLRRAFPAMRATLAYGQYELTMPFGAAAS